MRGFDLYRITLAYLAVVFALCAVVVFEPWREVRPAPDVAALSAPGPQAPAAAAGSAAARPAEGAPDPAEVVAALVAQSFAAEFGEELGEGDAATGLETGPDPAVARVARGFDVAYSVAPGDSLGSVALRFYGDSALAPEIFQANRGLMASPDNLRVGQVLIIPGRS